MKYLLILACLCVSAFAQTGYEVQLTWQDSATGVTFNVYRATAQAGPFSIINSSPVTVLSFNDTSVTPGQTYWYYMTAYDGHVESNPSTKVSAVIPQPPAAPVSPTATVKAQ